MIVVMLRLVCVGIYWVVIVMVVVVVVLTVSCYDFLTTFTCAPGTVNDSVLSVK